MKTGRLCRGIPADGQRDGEPMTQLHKIMAVMIVAGAAQAQSDQYDENGRPIDPGTYHGSMEMQRQSDQQDQQFRQQQQYGGQTPQTYGQPSAGPVSRGAPASAARPSTCDFIKLAVVDATNDFKDIAAGRPPAKGFIKLKDFIFPVGWTTCGVGIGMGGPVLICTIDSPRGRPAGEGRDGIRAGTRVIGGCVPPDWRQHGRADGVNFEDPRGINKLSLTVGEYPGGAYSIVLGMASAHAIIPKQ